MISDEVWDKVREAWKASIPEQYRWTGKDHTGSNAAAGAIIGPPPPAHMLAKFFAQFTPHLTKRQLHAKAMREKAGRPGRKKGESLRRRNRNRAKVRAVPRLPSV